MSNSTPPDSRGTPASSARDDADTAASQAAWNGFADSLKSVGEKIVGITGARGPRERADGYRYLVGLLAAAHELEMEVDRSHPRLTRMFTPMRSFVADGIDTLYHEAKLYSDRDYVCTVRRGDDIFFSIVVYASDDDGMREMGSHLIDTEMVFDETGLATIHIGPTRPAGAENWLELSGHDPFILTRQYFPESVLAVEAGTYNEAQMTIRCLQAGPAANEYSASDLSAGLGRVLDFMNDTVDAALGISAFVAFNMIEIDQGDTRPTRIDASGQLVLDEERHDPLSPDELAELIDPKAVANNLPGPGIEYVGAAYKLGDDEVICIAGTRITCRYWSCQLLDQFLQCGDYRLHTVSLNDRQVRYDDDGSFRIYAGATNPGVANWMDTEGHRRGQIVLRTLLAEDDMDPELSVIKVADIPDKDRV